jgi:hypothetical protein
MILNQQRQTRVIDTKFVIQRFDLILLLIELVPQLPNLVHQTIMERRRKIDPADSMAELNGSSIPRISNNLHALPQTARNAILVGIRIMMIRASPLRMMISEPVFFDHRRARSRNDQFLGEAWDEGLSTGSPRFLLLISPFLSKVEKKEGRFPLAA